MNDLKSHTEGRRIAYYGGTFDPLHCGHLNIAKKLVDLFDLDEFVFVPAFHAPHKPDTRPTSAYHRYAMLCLATENEAKIRVSLLEIESGEKRYSLDTLTQLKTEHPENTIYFVMGADSWQDITTWYEWERVLMLTNHIVVSRPGYKIDLEHVTPSVRERIVDMRGNSLDTIPRLIVAGDGNHIFITDIVEHDVSATLIREDIREDDVLDRTGDVPVEVAKYIEKYKLYK